MIEIKFEYCKKKLYTDEIFHFLESVDDSFKPLPLSAKVDLYNYSMKLHNHATHFVCEINNELAGFCACYLNNYTERIAFISLTVVHKSYQGMGLGQELTRICERNAFEQGFVIIEVEVAKENIPSIKMHEKLGYKYYRSNGDTMFMRKRL